MDIEKILNHHRPELEEIAEKFGLEYADFIADVVYVVRTRHEFLSAGRFTIQLGNVDEIVNDVMNDLRTIASDRARHGPAVLRGYLADPI